jgi:RimJ/RimL family protein N-acetyltransferase
MATSGKSPAIMDIDRSGEAIGGIGLHVQEDIFTQNVEIGHWLAEPFWGKSIMPYFIILMLDYGWQHFTIDRIFARPFGSNFALQRVLEKLGFILEARFEGTLFKNERYEDALI